MCFKLVTMIVTVDNKLIAVRFNVKKLVTTIFTSEAIMKTISSYVDDLYNKFGSDYKAAIKLNITKMSFSHIRRRGKFAA